MLKDAIRCCLVAALLTGLGTVSHAQDGGMKKTGKMIDNPLYLQWSKYKPGTFVTTRTTSAFGEYKTTSEMTTTLKEVSESKVVVSMKTVTVVAGQKMEQPATEQTFEAKMEEWAATEPGDQKVDTKTEESKETLTIAGVKVACKVIKATTTMAGAKTVTKTWTSTEVPGGIVKSKTEMQGGSTSSLVTSFAVK